MKLLVTGGAGFIGSYFIRRWIARHPADAIVNLDLLTYAGSTDRLRDVAGAPQYQFCQGDICDAAAVRAAIDGCDTVVHFAAETHVDRSIVEAAPFLRTNIEGTRVLLEAARAVGVARVVHVSTDEVYGPVLDGAVDETAPLNPHSPYAASKAAGDLLVHAHRKTYGLPALIVRPTNAFGPGQFPEKFMPLCITHALQARPVPIYGDGRQRRNWLYVDDLAAAVETVVLRGAIGEVYNIGSGHEQANLETAALILAALGQPSTLLQHVDDRPGHDRRYSMTDAKLRALGWRAATPFQDALSATIAWYRANEAWWRPLADRHREDPHHWLNRPAGASAKNVGCSMERTPRVPA